MKKLLLIATMLLVVGASSAAAQNLGAIKVDLEPDVGWVILMPTASGRLIVTTHLDNGLPDEEFLVSVRVRYEDQTTDVFQDVAVLTTNRQGKGNAQAHLDIHPPEGDETLRRVAVRIRRAPNPLYLAVVWDIPLK